MSFSAHGRQEANLPKDGEKVKKEEQVREDGGTRLWNYPADLCRQSCVPTPGRDHVQMTNVLFAHWAATVHVADRAALMK